MKPVAWEMLFRAEDVHGESWEGNNEITRDREKAEADGKAMVEKYGMDEWTLMPFYTAPPEVEALVGALRDSTAMLEGYIAHYSNEEGAVDFQITENRAALAQHGDEG